LAAALALEFREDARLAVPPQRCQSALLPGVAFRCSGEEAVADALRHALVEFTDDDGAVRLRGWYRVAIADV